MAAGFQVVSEYSGHFLWLHCSVSFSYNVWGAQRFLKTTSPPRGRSMAIELMFFLGGKTGKSQDVSEDFLCVLVFCWLFPPEIHWMRYSFFNPYLDMGKVVSS